MYVANGSIQAHVIFDGVITVTILVFLIGLAKLYIPYAGNSTSFMTVEVTLRFLLGQATSLIIAIPVLFLCYQKISNMISRFPSRLAGGTALLIAVAIQTIFFYLIAYGGFPDWWQGFGVSLVTKILLALLLWPLFLPYLFRITPKLPITVRGNSSSNPRLFHNPRTIEVSITVSLQFIADD